MKARFVIMLVMMLAIMSGCGEREEYCVTTFSCSSFEPLAYTITNNSVTLRGRVYVYKKNECWSINIKHLAYFCYGTKPDLSDGIEVDANIDKEEYGYHYYSYYYNADLKGLKPGTTYFFCLFIKSENGKNIIKGDTISFTTKY